METSILTSTKKILGLEENYTAFDPDILTHINSALSTLHTLGLGPENGLYVTDKNIKWQDLIIPPHMLGMVQTYFYLKVRMLFDPPTTSFHTDAMKEQIREHEWRLSAMRDEYLRTLEGV